MELSKEQLLSSAKYLRDLAETARPLEGREYLAKAELAERLADQYPSRPVPILDEIELMSRGWTCRRDWNAYPPTLKEVHEWRQTRRRWAASNRTISLTAGLVNRMHRMTEAEKCYKEIGLF